MGLDLGAYVREWADLPHDVRWAWGDARLGGVAPERAVFLDDWAGNVAAAQRVGLHGLLVGDPPDAALAALERLLAA